MWSEMHASNRTYMRDLQRPQWWYWVEQVDKKQHVSRNPRQNILVNNQELSCVKLGNCHRFCSQNL